MSHDVENKRPINDNNVVDTPTSTLLSQFIAARGAITQLNTVVNALLDGQGGIGRKATQLAYTFTISCIENPQEASNIPGWNDAGVQKGSNPYVQPLKLLCNKMDTIPHSRISIWAKVFNYAHNAKVHPNNFTDLVAQNHGMRKFYDLIIMKDKVANDNKSIKSKVSSDAVCSGATPGKANPLPKLGPLPFADLVENAGQIQFVIVDKAKLQTDETARIALEQNAVFIGVVDVEDTKCRKFLNDNDPRLILKGAA